MQITAEALKEYEQLWKEDHPGMAVDPNALLAEAERVMQLARLIYYSDEQV